MRSFLKIFLTMLVLACAFVGYLMFQPKATRQVGATRAPEVQKRHAAGDAIVGGGQEGWVRQFDEFGNLSSRFRLTEWEPPENGLVHVIKPEAELYFKGKGDSRARISITGADGQVTAESLPGAGAADSPLDPKNANAVTAGGGPAQPPSSGRLNHVVIRVFESEASAEPMMTLKTNNIVFDNEAFRISTETYTDINGTVIPADQVAVIVEGHDFDFFGRGLTLRWNDVDQRLEYLRIAHGDKLVLKNPSSLSGSMFGGKDKKKSNPIAQTFGGQWAPLLPMLASADPAAAGDAISTNNPQQSARKRKRKGKEPAAEKRPQTQPAARKPQPPYRAVFADQVRIDEGEQRVATADVMNVDFFPGSQDENKPGKKPTTRPVTRPTTGPATGPSTAPTTSPAAAESGAEPAGEVASPGTAPATAPVANADLPPTREAREAELASASTRPTSKPTSRPTPATGPATAASTAPAVQPITIYWVGELTVTPSTLTALPTPLDPGEAEVELVATAAPVVLTRDNTTVHCARAAYRTDNTLAIDKSDKFPEIVMTHVQVDDDAKAGKGPGANASAAGAETKVTTESVWYSFADRIATMKGHSRVTAPLGSGSNGAPGMLDAAWRDEAKFHLVGARQDELTLERADFSGAVDIKAPQGKVKSEKLALVFDPLAGDTATEVAEPQKTRVRGGAEAGPFANAKQPDLRRIIATEKVACELADERDGKKKTIECDNLELETAKSVEGKLYPQVVTADGAVHASNTSEDLRAGHVVVKLKPAPSKVAAVTRPATEPADHVASNAVEATPGDATSDETAATKPVRVAIRDAAGDFDEKTAAAVLESMLATDGVKVTSRDGAVATGDRLSVVMDGGKAQPHVELSGSPARVVDDKNGSFVSKTIILDAKTGIAHAPGEGSLSAVKRDEKDPSKPGSPIEVSWADGADLDSNANHIDVVGKVLLKITEPDGSVRTATAGRVGVELVDKSPAGPNDPAATKPAKARQGGGAPVDPSDSMQAAALKNKAVGVVTLRDDAAVDSQLLSPDGKTVLQRVHLKSSVVEYDVRTFHLAVPGPGQMLVENRSDPANEEAKQAKAKAKADKKGKGEGDADSMSMNDGATAFQWSNRLEFDKAAGRATMDGSVVVTHQPDDKNEPPVRIDADRLLAEFVPDTADASDAKSAEAKQADAGTGQVASAGGVAEGAKLPRLKVKSFSAVGNILISRDGAELSAGRIDYDPATDWVIARGSGRTPAIFTHPSGRGSATAGELWLNPKTWQVKVVDASTRAGGPTR